MTSEINSTTSWAQLMKLASQVTGKSNLSTEELQKLLEEADKNGDGILELQEFKDAFLTAEEYMKLEEEFLEAFEKISKLDKDNTSISESDIENAIKEYDASLEVEPPPSNGGGGGGGGNFGGNNGGNNGGDKKTAEDLSQKELPELKAERSELLTDIGSKRAEKEQAIEAADLDIETKQEAFDDATEAFNELIQEKVEAEKTTNEYAKEVDIYEDQKNAINTEISNQESVVSEATSLVSTISGELSSLVAPPETIEYYNEETKTTESKRNPAYDAYLAQKAALEAELAQAEADLAEQEATLQTLQADLVETEATLMEAINAYMKAEEEAGTLTQEERDIKAKIDEASETYHTAVFAKVDIESAFDKEIDAMQDELVAYNDAITEKELELPEGYGVEDGKITNGENNLVQLGEEDLPEGYKIEGTSIKDAEGNIVGMVTGEGENQQLYLTEEIEPPSKGFGEVYNLARAMFELTMDPGDEPVAPLWEQVFGQEFSSEDMSKIEELYNGFVAEYNEKLEEGEVPANEYLTQAEKELSGSDAAKEVYQNIVETLDRAENKIEVKPDTFETYLEGKNVDIANASPEELEAYLEEYVEEKYDTGYNEGYYPPVSEEALAKYLGEGGLETLAEDDESAVQAKIAKILNDEELSPYEQMQMVSAIKEYSADVKSYVDNYFKKDDTYFYEKLEEMSAATNEDGTPKYTQEDKLEFLRQYKGVDSGSGVLEAAKENDTYLKTILSLYEGATTAEEKSELDTYVSASALVDVVNEKYTGEEAAKYTEMLFEASLADTLSSDGKISTNPADYGLDDDKAASLKDKYINGSGSTSDKVNNVLEALEKGEITQSAAQYVVSSLFGGDPTKISGIQNVGNNNTVKEIFKLFDSKPYAAFGEGVKLTDPKYIVDGDYHYMLMGPENVDPNEPLPLIVYLGGAGEYKAGEYGTVGTYDRNGNGTIEEHEVKYNSPGTILSGWNLEDFNGYVIAPSLDGVAASEWATKNAEEYVRGIVSSFTETHNVNADMIFVGGHSLGGIGAFYMADKADDIFSKAFVLSGYGHGTYNIADIDMPIIGYNGVSDSGFMSNQFAKQFGADNLVNVKTGHGAVPVNAFQRDADGNGRSDLIEWLLEGKELPTNSDEY